MEVSQCAIMEHEKEKIKWTKTSDQNIRYGQGERVMRIQVEKDRERHGWEVAFL